MSIIIAYLEREPEGIANSQMCPCLHLTVFKPIFKKKKKEKAFFLNGKMVRLPRTGNLNA